MFSQQLLLFLGYDYGKVYLGCYKDSGTRDLPVYKGRPDSATNDVCMDLCTQEVPLSILLL